MKQKQIPREIAEDTAYKVVKMLKPFCEKIMVVGSLRRKTPKVHDIDILLIPNPLMWSGSISNKLIHHMDAEITRNGPLIKQFTIDGIQVDLIHADRENWGIRQLRWTGSAKHNIRLAIMAKKRGMKLAVSKGVLNKKGDIIASRTEEEIFEKIGLDYIKPEDREVNKSDD